MTNGFMDPRVSVVINTIDRAHTLRVTLHSLTQLDYPNFEVVVVCGPSSDDTEDVLREFAGRIRVGRVAKANLSESRNLGIAMAAGDYVAFIDDDAYPDPAWLTRLVDRFRDEEVAAVGGPVYDFTGVIHQTRALLVDRFGNWRMKARDWGPSFSYPGSLWAPYAMGTNSIYRRERLLEVGGFDEEIEYHIDEAEVCRRLVDAGYVIAYAEDAFVHHKVLASRLRTGEGVWLSRYPILKNTCYYALRHGLRTTSLADVSSNLSGYADQHRAMVEAAIEQGGLAASARDLLEDDIARAFDTALDRVLHQPPRLRPRHWFNDQRGGFVRFPIRRRSEHKLHVCLLADEYLPGQLNGIARSIHTLATGLAERGHLVRVLYDGPEPGRVDLMEGVWVHRVPIRYHEAPHHYPVPAVWHYSMSMLEEIRRLHRIRQVDIVQAPNWGAAGPATMGAPEFKTVLSLHTPLKTVAQMDHRLQGLGRRAREGRRLIDVESRVYPLPDLYIATTPAIVDEVEQQYSIRLDPSKVAMVGHGLPDRSKTVRATTHAEVVEVLYVGRLEPRKGIDTLLDCIPAVCERHPELRVTVVGNDQIKDRSGRTYRERFEMSDEGRRCAAQVQFTGLVDEQELVGRYAGCDIFVAPSRYESFGLILLEAMMFGKPLVACSAGGMRRIVEPDGNGFLIPPGDATALGDGISTLAASRELRERFGRRSRELYEAHYSADRMVTETNAAYDKLIGRNTVDISPDGMQQRPLTGVGVQMAAAHRVRPNDGEPKNEHPRRGGRALRLSALRRREKRSDDGPEPRTANVWSAQDVL
ncbi:MAG: glycosyltransferase, partial [Acidimicrobiaceae bacterium]|nr:glycosyltransferase [Acidimicrobiaceae bacterium]